MNSFRRSNVYQKFKNGLSFVHLYLTSKEFCATLDRLTVPSILQISTINGATVLGIDDKYGSIKKGKKADFLIWNKSPFDNYENFLADKVIIKDGVVLSLHSNSVH